MNLLTTQNLASVTAGTACVFGGLIAAKGMKDLIKDKKLSGIATMALGVSIVGAAGFGYSYYSYSSNIVPPLDHCSHSPESTHPSCSRIFVEAHNILGRTKGGLESFHPDPITKITEKEYVVESMNCTGLKEKLFCRAEFRDKRNFIHGEIDLNNTFNSIPGAERFKKLQIYIRPPPLSVKVKEPVNRLFNILFMQDDF